MVVTCKDCGKRWRIPDRVGRPVERCAGCWRELRREKTARWRAANPEHARRLDTKAACERRRRANKEAYDRFLKEQEGRCAICGTDKPGGRSKRFHLDHDHETGELRGLLCMRCNVALGLFKDALNVLKAAVAYLSL